MVDGSAGLEEVSLTLWVQIVQLSVKWQRMTNMNHPGHWDAAKVFTDECWARFGKRTPGRGMSVKLQEGPSTWRGTYLAGWPVGAGRLGQQGRRRTDAQGGWVNWAHLCSPVSTFSWLFAFCGPCAEDSPRLLVWRRGPKRVRNKETLSSSTSVHRPPYCPEPPDHPQQFFFPN